MRQRRFETVGRRTSPIHLSGATPGTTGMAGYGTTRESLRSAAGDRAYDELGRAALPHTPAPPRR